MPEYSYKVAICAFETVSAREPIPKYITLGFDYGRQIGFANALIDFGIRCDGEIKRDDHWEIVQKAFGILREQPPSRYVAECASSFLQFLDSANG